MKLKPPANFSGTAPGAMRLFPVWAAPDKTLIKKNRVNEKRIAFMDHCFVTGIKITVNAPTTVRRDDSSQSLSQEIKLDINSELYTVLTIANSILQFEMKILGVK